MRVLIRLLIAAVLLTVAACGSEGTPERAGADLGTTTGSTPAADPDSSVSNDGSVTSGGASASCVETYNLDNLKKRDFAFDGTTKSVQAADNASGQDVAAADRVTFGVREWFKGGSGDEVTLQAYGFGGTTSAGGEPRKIGDRLLVAGDDDYLWECGFTQGYDASVAADWEAALG